MKFLLRCVAMGYPKSRVTRNPGKALAKQRGKMCQCVCVCMRACVCVSPLMLIMDIGIQSNCALLIQVILLRVL